MRRLLALGVAGWLVAAGCSSASHHDSAPSTTTTTVPNPDGPVPTVITPAYVDAVFVVLNHVYGDATRALHVAHSVTPLVVADLRAVFSDPLFTAQVQSANAALKDAGLSNVKADPGDTRTLVERLITGQARCIFVEVSSNFAAIDIHPVPPPASDYYELQPKVSANDPRHLNDTPWAISIEETFSTPTSAPSTCG